MIHGGEVTRLGKTSTQIYLNSTVIILSVNWKICTCWKSYRACDDLEQGFTELSIIGDGNNEPSPSFFSSVWSWNCWQPLNMTSLTLPCDSIEYWIVHMLNVYLNDFEFSSIWDFPKATCRIRCFWEILVITVAFFSRQQNSSMATRL